MQTSVEMATDRQVSPKANLALSIFIRAFHQGIGENAERACSLGFSSSF